MITIHDLRDLKNICDDFAFKNMDRMNKNETLTILKYEQLKSSFVKAAKEYYNDQSLDYISAIKMYNKDINKLNIDKNKTR